MSRREIEEYDFTNSDLQGCRFDGLELRNLNFSGADIRGTSFRDTQIQNSQFQNILGGVSEGWRNNTSIISCFLLIPLGLLLSGGFSSIVWVMYVSFSRESELLFSLVAGSITLIVLSISCYYIINEKLRQLAAILFLFSFLSGALNPLLPSSGQTSILYVLLGATLTTNASFIGIRIIHYLDYINFKLERHRVPSRYLLNRVPSRYLLKRSINIVFVCLGILGSIPAPFGNIFDAIFTLLIVSLSLGSYFVLSQYVSNLARSYLNEVKFDYSVYSDSVQTSDKTSSGLSDRYPSLSKHEFFVNLARAVHSMNATDFSKAKVADSDFKNAALGFSKFRYARLIRTDFADVDLRMVDFTGVFIERSLSNAASYQADNNFGIVNFGAVKGNFTNITNQVSRLDSGNIDVTDQKINVTSTTHLHDASVIGDANIVGTVDIVSDDLWEVVAEELATLLRTLKKKKWRLKKARIASKSVYSEVRSLSEELSGILEEIRTIEINNVGDVIPAEVEFVSSFFAQAGAEIANREVSGFTVSEINGRLSAYVPFRVMVGDESLADQKFDELFQLADNETAAESDASRLAFWVFYGQLSEASRNKIIQLRTQDNRCVIPVAYDLIAATLKSGGSATGRLADIYNQYLPGANLFEDSSSIAHAADFYGRFSLVSQLRQALIKQVANMSRQQSIALLGLRKSGKTSVLRQLQTEFAISDTPVLRIDLSQYLGQSQWGHSLFREIIEGLNEWANSPIKTRQTSVQPVDTTVFQQKQPAPTVTSAFREALLQALRTLHEQGWQLPVILLLDEVEAVMPQKTDPDLARYLEFNAVFGSFRAIAQEIGQLVLVLADVHPDFNRANVWSRSGVDKNPVYQYFKEVYLGPFALSDTHIMLKDLGSLMGVRFDPLVIEVIHQQSGGHPFIARRIAGFLYQKAREESWLDEVGRLYVSSQAAAGYLENILEEFEPLDGYFEANIWADLQLRQEETAMAVLKILAINDHSSGISRTVILQKLSEHFSDGQNSSKTLSLLMNLGLVKQVRTEGGDRHYKISIGLLAAWVLTICQQAEINDWRIDS